MDHIEIGFDDTAPILGDEIYKLIHVPAKNVLFEDGSTVAVGPFGIAKHPISVGQVEAFSRETGYQTLAERQNYGMGKNYRNNELLFSKRTRNQSPAYVMAYEDALAYCDWARVRLPSEAEWLAASVLDERFYEDDEMLQVCRQLSKREDAIVVAGNEWTSTPAGPDRMIVRSRPYLLRTVDWARHGRQGWPRHRGDLDLLYTFRVCKDRK